MREIEREERLMEADKLKTEMSKKKFISEIKSGLGKEIKQNAGVVKTKKVSFFRRILNTIMETF
jgi:hypothetical protein|tara:strand:+ start:197 stop:388 length:192 start_codon:yes stop_codon:yes gene_type:complete